MAVVVNVPFGIGGKHSPSGQVCLAAVAEIDPVLGLVLSAAVLVLGLARWTIVSYEHDDENEAQA